MASLHGVDSAAERRALTARCGPRADANPLGWVEIGLVFAAPILVAPILGYFTGLKRLWVGALLVAAIIVISAVVRRWVAVPRELPGVLADAGRCVACGYLLDAASSERCPECGAIRRADREA